MVGEGWWCYYKETRQIFVVTGQTCIQTLWLPGCTHGIKRRRTMCTHDTNVQCVSYSPPPGGLPLSWPPPPMSIIPSAASLNFAPMLLNAPETVLTGCSLATVLSTYLKCGGSSSPPTFLRLPSFYLLPTANTGHPYSSLSLASPYRPLHLS